MGDLQKWRNTKRIVVLFSLVIMLGTPLLSFPVGRTMQSGTLSGPPANHGSGVPAAVSVSYTPNLIASIQENSAPGSMANDPNNGCVYVSLFASDEIAVMAGTSAQNIATISLAAGSAPAGIVYDPSNQNLYITDYKSNQVSVINAGTSLNCNVNSAGSWQQANDIPLLSSDSGPSSIVLDPVHNSLYVDNQLSSTISEISLNGAPTVSSQTVPGMAGTGSIGWNHPMIYANGYVYIAPCDPNGQYIDGLNTVTNQFDVFIRSGQDPFLATLDQNGNVYYDNSNQGTVTVINPSNQIIATVVLSGAFSNPGIGAYDPVNQEVYVGDSGNGNVYAIDGSAGVMSTTVPAFVNVGASVGSIAFDTADQNIYVGTKDFTVPHVVVIDPTKGIVESIDIGASGTAICSLIQDPAFNLLYASNCPVWQSQNFVAVIRVLPDFEISTADPTSLTLSGPSPCGVVHVTFQSIPTWRGILQGTGPQSDFSTPNPRSMGPVYAGFYKGGTIYTTSVLLGSGSSTTLPLAIWADQTVAPDTPYTITVNALDNAIDGGGAPTPQLTVTVAFSSNYLNECSPATAV